VGKEIIMASVFKYPLKLITRVDQKVEMPSMSKILTVHDQYMEPVLWALVEPKNKTVERYFRVVATGKEAPSGSYLGTVFIEGHVWHVFEVMGK
jgi:hypothetical protein